MSIRLRLTLWYSVVLAATLVAFGMAIYFIVNYNSYNDLKSRIQKKLDITIITDTDSLDFFVGPGSNIGNEQFVQIVNYTNGDVKKTSNLGNLQFPYPSYKELKANHQYDEKYVHLKIGGYPFLVYEKPITPGNQLVGYLQVAVYSGREDKLLADLRTILIFASLIAVLIAFTIGLFLARQALRPIENVIRASDQIQNGSDLSVRIPREGPNDEMGMLADTLNNMLGRLETTYNGLDEAYKMQRRFVSDASHELRTPLTTIRGNIELLERMWLPELEAAEAKASEERGSVSPAVRDRVQRGTLTREALKDIADEAKRMTSLVNDLLALARADAGYVMEKQVQPVLPLVEDVARRAQLLPRTAEWRIGDLKPLEGAMVNAHGDFLRQLFFIFVENAFKYTPGGYVELRALRAAGQVGVVVQDTGIGMDSEEIPHIFERFYRADESRGKTSGTGLGLSIAKWIIDEHGGSVEVSTREGQGTTFTVWLPVAFPGNSNQV